jgi:pimeloyl-ACP methyl ester carboxylesterase
MDSWPGTFREIVTPAARLRARVAGAGPLVLFVHGFPESWYSWRHQLGPVAQAGYTACAIDVRGYGGSQRFAAVADYAMEPLVGDIIGVADALQPDAPVILVGHDWGAPQVWTTALARPDRIAAVCGLSVGFVGVPQVSFDAVIKAVFDDRDRFFYQSYFREPGRAEAALEAAPEEFLRKFLFAIAGEAPDGWWPTRAKAGAALLDILPEPPQLPPWLSPADLAFYAGEFRRSGFFGPLSRYRNHTRDFDWLQQFQGRALAQPSLFIAGDRDGAFTGFGLMKDPLGTIRSHLPGLVDAHILPGCGHWTQQERPAEVTEHLLAWLAKLRG